MLARRARFGGSEAVVESRIRDGEVIFPVGGSVPSLARSFVVAACTQPTPEWCRGPAARSLVTHPWISRSGAEEAAPQRPPPGKDLGRHMSVPSDLCRCAGVART